MAWVFGSAVDVVMSAEGAIIRIPRVVAARPGQLGREGGAKIEQDVTDENGEVDANIRADGDHAVAEAFHQRAAAPNADGAERRKLPECHFHEEDGQPGDGQHDDVWDEKSASTVFVAKVGKSPNVAESH